MTEESNTSFDNRMLDQQSHMVPGSISKRSMIPYLSKRESQNLLLIFNFYVK